MTKTGCFLMIRRIVELTALLWDLFRQSGDGECGWIHNYLVQMRNDIMCHFLLHYKIYHFVLTIFMILSMKLINSSSAECIDFDEKPEAHSPCGFCSRPNNYPCTPALERYFYNEFPDLEHKYPNPFVSSTSVPPINIGAIHAVSANLYSEKFFHQSPIIDPSLVLDQSPITDPSLVLDQSPITDPSPTIHMPTSTPLLEVDIIEGFAKSDINEYFTNFKDHIHGYNKADDVAYKAVEFGLSIKEQLNTKEKLDIFCDNVVLTGLKDRLSMAYFRSAMYTVYAMDGVPSPLKEENDYMYQFMISTFDAQMNVEMWNLRRYTVNSI
jgi:hypothetical protein